MWHYGYGSASWLWMAGMMMLMSVVTAVVIIAIVRATRRSHGGDAADAAEGARRVLDGRYARGELGHDEYEERRRRLTAAEPTRRSTNPRP